MPGPSVSVTKRALVVCYSSVGRDARVTKQIRWLEASGYRVDVLSRGPEHPDATGRALRIGFPPLWLRLLGYLMLPPRGRFRSVVARHLPSAELKGQRYDLVLVNDHQLLPWAVETMADLADGPVILDLHELYSANGSGGLYRLLHARYDDWLLTFIADPIFTRHLTVADGIADIYRDDYGLTRPAVIRNVAFYEDLEPSPVDPDEIVLVHHGYAAVERGIDIMLDAMLLADPRYRLELMVLGDARSLAPLRAHPAVKAGRARFREPVGVTEVARALNEYDLELIFFPPRFPNNTYALPNKFFEAVQGRLGVIIGRSPEIVPFVEEYGFGRIVDGWTGTDLAAVLNALTADEIAAMKAAAARAALELSDRGERLRFEAALGI